MLLIGKFFILIAMPVVLCLSLLFVVIKLKSFNSLNGIQS